MRREDIGAALSQALTVQPVVSVLVPVDMLASFVIAAREVSFAPDVLADGLSVKRLVPENLVLELDRASEAFADMADLGPAIDRQFAEREELRGSVGIVRDWLDAGCITLPPEHHIRALVESLA